MFLHDQFLRPYVVIRSYFRFWIFGFGFLVLDFWFWIFWFWIFGFVSLCGYVVIWL